MKNQVRIELNNKIEINADFGLFVKSERNLTINEAADRLENIVTAKDWDVIEFHYFDMFDGEGKESTKLHNRYQKRAKSIADKLGMVLANVQQWNNNGTIWTNDYVIELKFR